MYLGPDSVHISGLGLKLHGGSWASTGLEGNTLLFQPSESPPDGSRKHWRLPAGPEAGLGPGELPALGPARRDWKVSSRFRGRCLEQAHLPFLSPELPISWRKARLREVGFLSAGYSLLRTSLSVPGLRGVQRLLLWAACPSPTSFRALRSPHFPCLCFAHRCSSGMCFLTTFQMSLQGSFLQEAHLYPCPSCCAAKVDWAFLHLMNASAADGKAASRRQETLPCSSPTSQQSTRSRCSKMRLNQRMRA